MAAIPIFPRPNLSLRVLPKVPATMRGANGMTIVKKNGIWTVQPDFSTLQALDPSIALDPSTKEIWIWDPILNVYNTMTLAGMGQALWWGTSATSTVIGGGAKTFVTQANKDWIPGMYVQVISRGTPADTMIGQVSTYAGPDLTVNVAQVTGAAGATHADWTILPTGTPGPVFTPSIAVNSTPISGGINGNFFFSSAGVFGERTPTQATQALNLFTPTLQGLVPASGGGVGFFLRADGVWTAPPPGPPPASDTGDIIYNGGGFLEGSANFTFNPTYSELTIGAAGWATGHINLVGTTSGVFGQKVAAAAGAWELTWPTTAGAAGQFLQTDGLGVCTWATAAGGGPGGGLAVGSTPISGGLAGGILFDTGTMLQESANFFFDDVALSLKVGGTLLSEPAGSSTVQGLNVSQIGPNFGDQTSSMLGQVLAYNTITVTAGTHLTSGSGITFDAALYINKSMLSNSLASEHAGLLVNSIRAHATNQTGDQVAALLIATASTSDGGTGLGTSTSHGGISGIDAQASLVSGATNYRKIIGGVSLRRIDGQLQCRSRRRPGCRVRGQRGSGRCRLGLRLVAGTVRQSRHRGARHDRHRHRYRRHRAERRLRHRSLGHLRHRRLSQGQHHRHRPRPRHLPDRADQLREHGEHRVLLQQHLYFERRRAGQSQQSVDLWIARYRCARTQRGRKQGRHRGPGLSPERSRHAAQPGGRYYRYSRHRASLWYLFPDRQSAGRRSLRRRLHRADRRHGEQLRHDLRL